MPPSGCGDDLKGSFGRVTMRNWRKPLGSFLSRILRNHRMSARTSSAHRPSCHSYDSLETYTACNTRWTNRASLDRTSVRHIGDQEGELADATTHVLVVGAREGSSREGHRAADGTREGRHDAQRVHAGDRCLATASCRHRRIRIGHYCSQTGSNGQACLAEALSWFEAARRSDFARFASFVETAFAEWELA